MQSQISCKEHTGNEHLFKKVQSIFSKQIIMHIVVFLHNEFVFGDGGVKEPKTYKTPT